MSPPSISAFDLPPNDAHKLDGIPDLFPCGHGVPVDVSLLAQPEGGDAAGVLQPPVIGVGFSRVKSSAHLTAAPNGSPLASMLW